MNTTIPDSTKLLGITSHTSRLCKGCNILAGNCMALDVKSRWSDCRRSRHSVQTTYNEGLRSTTMSTSKRDSPMALYKRENVCYMATARYLIGYATSCGNCRFDCQVRSLDSRAVAERNVGFGQSGLTRRFWSFIIMDYVACAGNARRVWGDIY